MELVNGQEAEYFSNVVTPVEEQLVEPRLEKVEDVLSQPQVKQRQIGIHELYHHTLRHHELII